MKTWYSLEAQSHGHKTTLEGNIPSVEGKWEIKKNMDDGMQKITNVILNYFLCNYGLSETFG